MAFWMNILTQCLNLTVVCHRISLMPTGKNMARIHQNNYWDYLTKYLSRVLKNYYARVQILPTVIA